MCVRWQGFGLEPVLPRLTRNVVAKCCKWLGRGKASAISHIGEGRVPLLQQQMGVRIIKEIFERSVLAPMLRDLVPRVVNKSLVGGVRVVGACDPKE